MTPRSETPESRPETRTFGQDGDAAQYGRDVSPTSHDNKEVSVKQKQYEESFCETRAMETYSLLRVIGEGSFGRAVLVCCKNTQQKYVLKEIQLSKNRSKMENSRREAVLLSGMKHPNIVAFREAFEADDLLCIVMEFCSGGDLLQRIRLQKTMQFCLDDILRWFAQMCAGAKHIHEKRVLHRDLKSKNIFLTDNGTIKLGDFGSACILNSSKAYAQTYVGTPYYADELSQIGWRPSVNRNLQSAIDSLLDE
ncbi:unnamed protein product, partial [Pleuronectes platessa]